MNHETIELAFVALAAIALVTQAVLLLAILIGVGKAAKSMKEELEGVRSAVVPVAEEARNLVARLSRLAPKIESTVSDVSEVTRVVRVQVEDVSSSAEQILIRVRRQTVRVDEIVTGALDAVDRAGVFVNKAVSIPVKQVSGILAGIKAMIESLNSTSASRGNHRVPDDREFPSDKDLFV